MNILGKPFHIQKEFIDYLQQLFPNKLPAGADVDIEELRFLQGQQSVLRRIEGIYDNDED
jgi:hypothetical protein